MDGWRNKPTCCLFELAYERGARVLQPIADQLNSESVLQGVL